MKFPKKLRAVIAVMALATCCLTGATTEAASPEETSLSIANYIALRNNSLDYDEAKNIADGITYYSGMYGVDPLLMTALFETESTFNQSAISNAGAIGIGQIMPDTAVSLGVNPYDTMQNIQGACSYMSTALKNFSDYPYPTETALAAYNAGGNAVIKYGGIPPYSETQNYVVRIRERYMNLRNMIGDGVTPIVQGDYNPLAPSYTNGAETVDYVEYVEQDVPVGEVLDAEDY